MDVTSLVIRALAAVPRGIRRPVLLAAGLLALVPLAGAAQAGVSDYPSPLYLAGPPSTVTGHSASYQLVGGQWAAPTASVAAGASTLSAGTYAYVYTVDTGSGETASTGRATAAVTTANGEQVTVSGLPTGALTVRLYRMSLSSPTNCYTRLLSNANNAQTSYTDTSGSVTCTNALRRAEDRVQAGVTGWTELTPGVTAPALSFQNTALVPGPAAANKKGWIVNGPGEVSFPAGAWTFDVETRANAGDGAVSHLVVAMWKIDSATGNPVGSAIVAPTEQVSAPTNLVTASNVLQPIAFQVDAPAFSLAANERLYVQFWRHQITAYAGTTGASNRVGTLFAWDGVAKLTHPAASGFATEPTLDAPADGASAPSDELSAVFNDPDASDSGTVEFRICTAPAAAGSACSGLVDTGSSASVAKGARATYTVGAALTIGGTYHWQARGHDALGGTSAWTATRSFRFEPPPGVPAPVAPADGAAATAFTLEGAYSDPGGGAGTLDFQVCPAAAAAGVSCTSPVAGGSSASVASGANASWRPGALAAGTYHWQARARNSRGTSAWSATSRFRVDAAPDAPALLAPAADAAGTSLVLEAAYSDPDGDAGSLELRICSSAAVAGEECRTVVSTGWFASVLPGASVRWASGPPLPDGVYHWQARARDALGAVSAWSATRRLRLDTKPPSAPAAIDAVVGADGLTLRWRPPSGSDPIGGYVVYVDGLAVQTLGPETYEAKLGAFDAADGRRFSVGAVDAAGNGGALTETLVGVPVLVGLTLEEARAALAARGLRMRARSASVAEGAVVLSQSPDAPSLVTTGSSVVAVFSRSAERAELLGFTHVNVVCSRGRLALSLSLAERARVTVTLLGRRGAVAAWRLGTLPEGARAPALRLPASLRRPGHFRVVVTATASGRTQRLSRPLTVARQPGCAPA